MTSIHQRNLEEVGVSLSHNDITTIHEEIALICTTVNEVLRTLYQVRTQLQGVPSTVASELEKWRANHTTNHWEVVAIAMKEVQSKSGSIERLERENRLLREKLKEYEHSALHSSEGFARTSTEAERRRQESSAYRLGITCFDGVENRQKKLDGTDRDYDHGEHILSPRLKSVQNINGKRPLINLSDERGTSEKYMQNRISINLSDLQAKSALDHQDIGRIESSEAEEIPESSNALYNGCSSIHDSERGREEVPVVSQELPENAATQPSHSTPHRPQRRARVGARKNIKSQKLLDLAVSYPQVKANYISNKDGDSEKIAHLSATIPSFATDKRKTEPFDPTQQIPTHLTRERSKRIRDRTNKTSPGPPTVEIITKNKSSLGTVNEASSTAKHLNVREAEKESELEDAEERRKATMVARELLVQAAMHREEACML